MTHIKNTIDLGINKVLEFCFFFPVCPTFPIVLQGGGVRISPTVLISLYKYKG